MRQTVNLFISRHTLLKENATVIVGVSGGPDSLALLHYLQQEQRKFNLQLVCAHVNHLLRGEESDGDYRFVQEYCQRNNILFEGKAINVLDYQKKHKVSLQVAARECRYQFFDDVMRRFYATFLALAHHGDDQIETIIMRQIRGAHGQGLAGIPVKRLFSVGEIIRPFLCVTKSEIEAYCEKEQLTPRLDKSNLSSKYMRNRVRNQIVPILKTENPAVHLRFQQQSERMIEDEQLLQSLAETETTNTLLLKVKNKVVLQVSRFNTLPVSLQRRGFQLILNYLYDKNIPEITAIHIGEFLNLMKEAHPSGSLHFPKGLLIRKSYDECSFTFLTNKQEEESYEVFLPTPGMVTVKKGKIISEVSTEAPSVSDRKYSIVLDLEKISLPLKIRNRKEGDRLALLGTNGSKKIKDLFIDEKVDRDERNSWPIVVDGNDRILWVLGLRRSSLALPSNDTKKYLLVYYLEENKDAT